MTNTLKEPLLGEGEQIATYRATQEDEATRLGSFRTPKDYLANLAYNTNLNELYDITGVQVTNAWQSHNQPYVIIVDVKEEELQKIYNGRYLIQIWKKVGEEQGTLLYEKPCQNPPGDFCIRKELCVYLTEDSSSSSINNDVETVTHNINIIDVATQKEIQIANPFGSSDGTQAYIDEDIMVVGSGKQIYVYETKTLISDHNLYHKELAIKCDQIMDINFTAVGKSYVVVSTVLNDGKTVQYHKISLVGEVKDMKSATFHDKVLSTSIMATFNCEIQGEKYVKCAIQPYDFYILLTDKGNFELFKNDGDKPPKLQFSSFKFFNPDANASVTKVDKVKENKTKILREMMDCGLIDIRIVYNFLCMKTKTQKKTYYVNVAKIQEFYPQIQNEEFDETMLQLAMFNPVFFNNHSLNEEDIMLTHERFVSIKNIPTGQWQHIELYPVDSHFRKKEAKLQVLQIYKVDEKQTFVVSKKDRKGWLIENKKVPAPEPVEGEEPPAEEPVVEYKWQSEEIDLQEGDDTKYIQHVWQCQNNLGVFFFDMRSEILGYRSIQKLEIKKKKLAYFFDHVVPDVNTDFKFIPLRQTGNALLYILWNQETKKASIHKEEMKPKQRKEYKEVSLAMHTFNGVESISATSYKKDSILILMNGMFYEFNLTESRLITHTKPTRGGIEKPPIETEELYIFNERFLYFIDEQDYILYIADLTQFRPGGFQIKDFVKVEVTSTFHRNLGFDLENERILVAKSRFQVQIMPFLHQSRIIFFKVMNNPDNFILHEHHKDKIYGFDKTGMLTVFNAINTHLDSYSQIGKEVVDMSEWQFVCMAGKHALLMKKEIVEEGKPPVKFDEVDHTYKAIHLDFESGQCQIKQSIAYTHRHKKFTNVRFSHDMRRMLEQNGKSDTCTIYDLELETQSRWVKVRELQDIKALAQVSTCMKYFYSPKTMKFLDVDVKGIVDQEDQQERFKLPEAIGRNVIEIMMKHDDHFVVIMKNNIAKEFTIEDGNIRETRYFIHHYDDTTVTRQYHTKSKIIFVQQKEELMQTLARLNDFYRFQTNYMDVTHKCKHYDPLAEDIKYHAMFSVSDSFADNKSQVNFPFTFFHWSLAEKLAQQEVRMPLLNKQILQELMFLIDPEGNSLLHKLSNQFRALKFCYDTINDEFVGIEKAPKCLDMIPYITNLAGITPLKLSAKNRDTKSCDQIMLMLKQAEIDNHQEEMQDFYKDAFDFNLTNIGDYFDKRLIPSDQVGLKIERGGLELGPGGFALTTTQIGENDIEKVKEETCVEDNIEVPIIMQVLDIPGIHRFDNKWSKDLLKCLADTPRLEIFQNKSLRGVLEYKWPEIKSSLFKRLFLPYMFFLMTFLFYSVYILNYYQFVNNLKDLNDLAEKKGIDNSTACQKQWFSDDNYVWQQEHLFNKSSDEMDAMCGAFEDIEKKFPWVLYKQLLKAAIIIFVVYFFANEARQMLNGVFNYLFNMWNYIDILPLVLISCVMILDWFIGSKVDNQKMMRSILSLAIFFLWVKFLYFLRLFRGTSYLITMILEVVKDMKTFLLLFLVSTLAFGNCFYVFNQNLGGDSFIADYFQSFTYAYEMVLGNFDTEKYTKGNTADYLVLYTLFVMSTLFLMIVMLNLLIAIISDSYGRVQQQAANLMYKGMADLIYENDYLLTPWQLEAFHAKAGDYLVIVVSEEEGADTSSVEGKLAQLQGMISTNHSALYSYVRNMKKDMDESSDKTSGFQTRVEGKMAKVEADIQTIAKEIKKQAEAIANQVTAAAEEAQAEGEGEEEKKKE